ncbi:MAG: carboxymuconolactone decarboxylase family protein [Candidatus Omnitrophica bacterium]|nr:carboxymuconolactone decarboxylase family protein [Candidatus Omnitrophota bacterium]
MRTAPTRRPKTLERFEARFPEVFRRYAALRDACDQAGPLPPKIRELIKIAVELARKRHGGLIAHIDRARRAGATPEEIAHTMLLALPLVGFPDVLAGCGTLLSGVRGVRGMKGDERRRNHQ